MPVQTSDHAQPDYDPDALFHEDGPINPIFVTDPSAP